MLIALDTNILVHAEGTTNTERHIETIELLKQLDPKSIVLPYQTLLELSYVLSRKFGIEKSRTSMIVQEWLKTCNIANGIHSTLESALTIFNNHQLQIFDAFILATASDYQCDLLLSQDMQHGFKWKNTTIVDPYRVPTHPLLKSAFLSPDS